MKGRRAASVENIETGVHFYLLEDEFELFKKNFIFHGWVGEDVWNDRYVDPDSANTTAVKRFTAEDDIHQMNKTDLIKEAHKLGLKVSNVMTVGKLKEKILDHKASIADDPEEDLDVDTI